jgi:hypothetical protein
LVYVDSYRGGVPCCLVNRCGFCSVVVLRVNSNYPSQVILGALAHGEHAEIACLGEVKHICLSRGLLLYHINFMFI